MKNKIAFISGFFCINHNINSFDENQKLMYSCLYNSGKKYFLKNNDVDFIFVNNFDFDFDGVINIKIKYPLYSYQHMLLMKILMLNYIDRKKYDYIFVNDGDQMFIDYVDDNFLKNDFNIMEHFFHPNAFQILNDLTNIIKIHDGVKNEEWTMGNFFGGKSEIFFNIVDFVNVHHEIYIKKMNNEANFYSIYPDEVFLMKFMVEKKMKFNRLNTITVPGISEKKYFLSDFQDDINLYPNINNTILLHNTKKNINTLKQINKYYI